MDGANAQLYLTDCAFTAMPPSPHWRTTNQAVPEKTSQGRHQSPGPGHVPCSGSVSTLIVDRFVVHHAIHLRELWP